MPSQGNQLTVAFLGQLRKPPLPVKFLTDTAVDLIFVVCKHIFRERFRSNFLTVIATAKQPQIFVRYVCLVLIMFCGI